MLLQGNLLLLSLRYSKKYVCVILTVQRFDVLFAYVSLTVCL